MYICKKSTHHTVPEKKPGSPEESEVVRASLREEDFVDDLLPNDDIGDFCGVTEPLNAAAQETAEALVVVLTLVDEAPVFVAAMLPTVMTEVELVFVMLVVAVPETGNTAAI